MKTVKLDKKSPPVDELLAFARREAILLVFDQEVSKLGSNTKFMSFLEERSREQGVISIE
ncbi:MAG: hypothetical protein KGL32_03825 [candidate division NC10 bacterium]|nr:hypothetical protein [candidate division NC10 bacterium]